MWDPETEAGIDETDDLLSPSLMRPEESTTIKALKDEANDLTDLIIVEHDLSKLEDLTKLFELNLQKKEIVRRNKLSKLVDAVDDELIRRVQLYPEEIDSELLLKYMTSTSNVILNIKNDGKPLVQITKQEVNINNKVELNAESRKRVLNAVQLILKGAVQNTGEDDEE